MALATAKLWVKVTAVTGSGDYRLYIDKGTSNWATSLDGNETEYNSTQTITCGTTAISSTGWHSFDITPSDIDNVTIYAVIVGIGEGTGTTHTATIASQNNATAADRPYLELVWSDGTVKRFLASLGVGN